MERQTPKETSTMKTCAYYRCTKEGTHQTVANVFICATHKVKHYQLYGKKEVA
jgi:hypothetical protein